MSLLRNYFWWTYERGSLHYDVMVTLILAFLFIAPHYIDFKDRPVVPVRLHASEVLVKNALVPGRLVFEVRAADIGPQTTDDDRRAAIARIIEPIAGEVTVVRDTPIRDAHGNIVAYDAVVTH